MVQYAVSIKCSFALPKKYAVGIVIIVYSCTIVQPKKSYVLNICNRIHVIFIFVILNEKKMSKGIFPCTVS